MDDEECKRSRGRNEKEDFSGNNWLQLGDVTLNDFRVGQNLRLI